MNDGGRHGYTGLYHAAQSIIDGGNETVEGNEQLRFARPPVYPAILAATGATNEGTPWAALLWNAVCVAMSVGASRSGRGFGIAGLS